MFKRSTSNIYKAALLAGAATFGSAAMWSASAQDSSAPPSAGPVEKVTVTGSRIRRTEFNAESPVTILDAKEIRQSGKLNLSMILRDQIGIEANDAATFNQSSNLSGGGAFQVDIRALGPDRVLTLINGRRVANFADSLQNEAKDLSFIPLAMVERVEILRDGASATYGADAVSGVLNVILKENFEGFETSVFTGISDFGDAESAAAEAVIGANFERGNAVFSLGYTFTGGVPQRDRPDWAVPSIAAIGGPFGVTNGSGFHPGGTILVGGAIGTWCTRPISMGGDELTNVGGTAACPSDPAAASSPTELVGRYDYALVQSILNETETIHASGFANFKIMDDLGIFLEAQVSNRNGRNGLDANPISQGAGSPAFPLGWRIPNTNPYNPLGVGGGNAFHLVAQRPTQIGARNQDVDANMYRTVAGLKGEDLAGIFEWELSFLWTKVTSALTTDATWNLARANRISDPAQCALDPLCVAALRPGSLGAMDVYRPANWGPTEIAYLRQVATSNSDFGLRNVYGSIVGDIFELPAGPVGFAAGVEYRDEQVSFRPDATTAAGESVANQTFATFGGFDTYEAFAETNIPLLKDMTLFKDLSLNLQGRMFDYSSFGSGSVYKTGLNWALVDDLRVRATYGTSFRAPTLVNSFSGGTASFDFITDPCHATNAELNPLSPFFQAQRANNCFTIVGPLQVPGGFTQSAPQLLVQAGGDIVDGTLDLQPETSEAWTLGAVITPTFLPGFAATVDWWNIALDNLISSVNTETELLDVCYNSVNLSAPECANVFRNPITRQLTGLTRFPINRPGVSTAIGLDWSAAYRMELFDGGLALNHAGTYTYKTIFFPGEGNCGGANGQCLPEYRLHFGAEFSQSDWSIGWRGAYTPAMQNVQAILQPNILGYTGPESIFNHDVHGSWNFHENFTLFAGVNNVAGDDPPYVFNTGNNTAPGLYGTQVIGRYYWMRIAAQY